MRVTRLDAPVPVLGGRLGYEEPDPIAEATPATDRAEGIDIQVPTSGTPGLVQSKVGSNSNADSSIAVTLDDDPAIGSLLVMLFTARGTPSPTFPSGWTTVHTRSTTTNGGQTWLAYKVATGGEPTTITITNAANYKRLVVAEFAGVRTLDLELSVPQQAAALSFSVGPITPSAATSLLVGWVNQAHKTNFTTDGDWTAVDEDGTLPTGGTDGPSHHFAYRILSSAAATSFLATSVDNVAWCGGIAAFVVGIGSVSGGPNATDGDDTTCLTTSGPVAALIDLGEPRRRVRARVRYSGAAGSKTYTIEGANSPDFSDAVLLDSETFTATGSAQDVTFNWESTEPDAYQYFRLSGNNESRSLCAWELYEASYQAVITDHGELSGLADNDHPQYQLAASAVGDLDDLSDVTITTPAAAQRLRYNGSAWVNTSLKWTPLTVSDGTNYLPLVDGSGNQIMAEA